MKEHILSAFDRDLEAIEQHILKMGGLVEEQIEQAAAALEDRDTKRAAEIVRADKAIDALEEQIDAMVVRVLALRQPQARDLRAVVSVLKIASNLERVGDYAKNLAKRTPALVEAQPIEGAGPAIHRMAGAVRGLLADALDAYLRRDAGAAEIVRARDEEIDQFYNALFRVFLTHMMEDARNITPCMHLLFIAKNLERVGDHVTSIAEQTIYQVTGTMPADDRPKGDLASQGKVAPDSGTGGG